jgi:hypothetical protein
MNSATKENFTAYFGSPNTVFIIVMVLLLSMMGVCLLKIVLSAWNDVRTDPNFDATDFFTTIIRMLVMLLIFGLLFFH